MIVRYTLIVKPETKEIDTVLSALAKKARLGDYADASRDLNTCLLLIQKARAGMATVPKPLLEKFNYSLETILLMLKNKDWVAIADIVEYELLALWREMADRIDRYGT
jgi:hypothetical protein